MGVSRLVMSDSDLSKLVDSEVSRAFFEVVPAWVARFKE